jgi:hypothetical protein
MPSLPEVPRDEALDRKVQAICLQDSVERAGMLCFLFVLVFAAYGMTSLDFIHRFQPGVTYWDNVWPRMLFNSFPLLALGTYLRKGKASDRTKFYLWITCFSLVVHASAWIFVWPIALSKSADILTYVHAANTIFSRSSTWSWRLLAGCSSRSRRSSRRSSFCRSSRCPTSPGTA